MKILGRYNTSHECEACDKSFAGMNSALIELDDGRQRIICADCRKNLKKAQKDIDILDAKYPKKR